jgi:hypothetical protein
MGYLKKDLSSEDNAYRRCICGRLELLGLIEDYRQGLLPLIVPLTLLKHHLNRYPVPEWVPVPSAALGTPAGVSASLSQGADAAESRVSFVSAADLYGIPYPQDTVDPKQQGVCCHKCISAPKCPNLTNPDF